MNFQLKDFASISASQINHARSVTDKITDFIPGSVARTLMEAPAVEIEELYMQMFWGLHEAIPVATFLSFGFEKLPAAVAHGWVSVSKDPAPDADLPIPVGTAFSATDGRVYQSTEAVLWMAGEPVVRIPVAYAEAGFVGNISGGAITSSIFFDTRYTISNAPIETGRDVESDLERKARFAQFVAALSRGTVLACEYAAKQAVVLDINGNRYEYVTRVGCTEIPGYVRFFVYSNRGVPSAGLLASGQVIIDGKRDELTNEITPGYRPAGVRVDIVAMSERAIDLSISVLMMPGVELTNAVRQRLGDVFSSAVRSIEPGGVLYLGTLGELMLAVPGVRQIVPSTTTNIHCAVNEALIPGSLTIAQL